MNTIRTYCYRNNADMRIWDFPTVALFIQWRVFLNNVGKVMMKTSYIVRQVMGNSERVVLIISFRWWKQTWPVHGYFCGWVLLLWKCLYYVKCTTAWIKRSNGPFLRTPLLYALVFIQPCKGGDGDHMMFIMSSCTVFLLQVEMQCRIITPYSQQVE